MNKNNTTYFLNGADRFQLFFDSVSRKNTGIGNIIRTHIIVDGIIPENKFHELVETNEAIRFLASLSPERKWFSPVYRWKLLEEKSTQETLTIHRTGSAGEIIQELHSKDCAFNSSAIHLDIIYASEQTHIFISANHALFDYAGMENFIDLISGNAENIILQKELQVGESFLKKVSNAIAATLFVAARSSWNFRRLIKRKRAAKCALEYLQLSNEDSKQVSHRLQTEIKSPQLSFFVGSSVFSLSKFESLLSDKKGDFFIAVPIDRRSASHKNVLLSNYLSFIYFHTKANDIESVKKSTDLFSQQMIHQARQRIPEKFSSLLHLFRFLPSFIYRLFLDLPSNGHSATFAFSLLANSKMENKSFMRFPVKDVTHFPPVLSPPGLNIVFTEFNLQLKIIISFDECRITKEEVRSLLNEIRKNLLN